MIDLILIQRMSQFEEFLKECFCVITFIWFALVLLILRNGHNYLLGNKVTNLIIIILGHSEKTLPYQIIYQ